MNQPSTIEIPVRIQQQLSHIPEIKIMEPEPVRLQDEQPTLEQIPSISDLLPETDGLMFDAEKVVIVRTGPKFESAKLAVLIHRCAVQALTIEDQAALIKILRQQLQDKDADLCDAFKAMCAAQEGERQALAKAAQWEADYYQQVTLK